MTYLVMECHLSYAVVMDEEGRFLKAANRNYEAGQIVTDIIEMQVPQKAGTVKRYRWRTLTAAAVLLLIVTASVFWSQQTTYASVYLKINPQIRIDVNRTDQVVGLAGVNEDGKKLIGGYDFRKKNLDTVTDEMVGRAVDMGYLYEGGKIMLTFDSDSEQWITEHGTKLSGQINESLETKLSVTIEVTDRNNRTVIRTSPEEEDYGDSDYYMEETVVLPEEGSDGDHPQENIFEEEQTDYDEPEEEEDGDSDYEDEEK